MYGNAQNGMPRYNQNKNIGYNMGQAPYMNMMQQQPYYNQAQHQPQLQLQQPPSVGLGIDDSPYDMDQMAIYHKQAESEDSDNEDNDENNSNDHDAQIDIGSYRDNNGLVLSTPAALEMHNEILPQMPDIPQMPQIPDINMKPEEEELYRHVGFVIKLNSRLVQLNAECRLLYPKLASDLVDSKVSQFQSIQYKKLVSDGVLLEKKCNQYEQQIQTLLPVQNLNNDLNEEINKLRAGLDSHTDSEYITELQKQLAIYRDKVIYLSNSVQSCMSAIKNSVVHAQTTQESISEAYNELKPLQEHLSFLEDNAATEHSILNAQISELKREARLKDDENDRLREEVNKYKEQENAAASEKIANKAQIEEHIEYKYKSQIQALEERLSKMTVARITMEDDFGQRQKQEQERADKYRAKYESVKQHVKTLEMQKIEYTRVNMQLRQQNNEFRSMITQLQNQLKMLTLQPQQSLSPIQSLQSQPQIDEFQHINKREQLQQKNLEKQQSIMRELRQVQHNQMKSQKQNQNRAQAQAQSHAKHAAPPNELGGNNPLLNHINHQYANSYVPAPPPQRKHQYSSSNPPPLQQQQSQLNAVAMQQQMMNMNRDQLDASVRNIIPVAHRERWGKRTKVISDKGTKKRLLVEWHFVTSDNQPHTVVLQHTQDAKPKTRRMLWVDGSEKYNNKSSASSFRIEIDKDVVVVSIDSGDMYQYRLTINNASYADAFKLWESRQR